MSMHESNTADCVWLDYAERKTEDEITHDAEHCAVASAAKEVLGVADVFFESSHSAHRAEREPKIQVLVLTIPQTHAPDGVAPEVVAHKRREEAVSERRSREEE